MPGCSRRQAAPEFERLAILRFENLGPDASADWMGRAFSEIIATELSAAPGIYAIPSTRIHGIERALGPRPVSAPGISAERGLAVASDANRIGYGYFWAQNGRLNARLVIEDPRTGKMNSIISGADTPDGVIAAASSLARQLWQGAIPYRSASLPALRAYVAALESNDPAIVSVNLQQAIAADADFVPAYRLLTELKAQQQDRTGALYVVGRALSRDLKPGERARLELDAADLRGDRGARLRALDTLSKLNPSDPTVWRALAETVTSVRQYPAAVNAYRKALAILPQDTAALNQLGYALAHAGDLPAAEASLRRYEALRPAEANPLDSLGDVNLLAGRLREAEALYLQAAQKQPHFEQDGPFFKAAMARLMTGDVVGADALARRYLEARAADKDPALEYRAAEWSWASGRRMQACSEMEKFAQGAANGPLRELAARAYAEEAIWELMLGDRTDAASQAQRAIAIAGPASGAIARVARFLTQAPASAPEWGARASREFSDPSQYAVRDFALAYALLFQKDFQAASAILQRIYDSGEQADGEALPVLLGWTYLETGRAQQASALLRPNPIPASSGAGPFFSFYFPRIYYLRAIAAERGGNRSGATADMDLFRKLSGPDPLIWDTQK